MYDLNKYERHLIGQRSENTIKSKISILKRFLNLYKTISIKSIEQYKERLIKEGKYVQARLVLIHIKQYLLYLKKYEMANQIVHLKVKKKLPIYLSQTELKSLIKATESNLTDNAIFNTFALTGLRVSELCNLDKTDVDLEHNTLKVRCGKGGKDRIALLRKELISILKEQIKRQGDRVELFSSGNKTRMTPRTIERKIKYYGRLAGIKKNIHPHTLRHSFATALLTNGADIRYIQELMGHESIASTQIYTHIERESLEKVYNDCSPKIF